MSVCPGDTLANSITQVTHPFFLSNQSPAHGSQSPVCNLGMEMKGTKFAANWLPPGDGLESKLTGMAHYKKIPFQDMHFII